MTYLNDLEVKLPSISGVEQQDAVEGPSHLKQSESRPPISPLEAFEEFVEDHSEMLRRLAL